MSNGAVPGQPEGNAPGLTALAYRTGTYATIFADMVAALHAQAIASGPNAGTRPLAALTTRATDDPAIALLDACAVVCDVLTFYEERIANEGFLRTATERRSVLELARAIGYELGPGVAAATYLAFTIDASAGAPPLTTVQAGTKVQSTPAQGALPQTFETASDLQAAGAWNALKPRLTRPQDLAIYNGGLWLLGITTSFPASAAGVIDVGNDLSNVAPLLAAIVLPANPVSLKAVPAAQVFFAGTGLGIKVGDRLLFVGQSGAGVTATLAFTANDVVEESSLARTSVTLTAQRQSPPPYAPAPVAPGTGPQAGTALPFTQGNLQASVFSNVLHDSTLGGVIALNAWNDQLVDAAANYQAPPPPPPLDRGAFVLRAKSGFFGAGAPKWASLPLQLRYPDPAAAKLATTTPSPPYGTDWDVDSNGAPQPNGPLIWTDSAGNFSANGVVNLDRVVSQALDGGWVLLEAAAAGLPRTQVAYRIVSADERVVTDYAVSARTTSLTLASSDGSRTSSVNGPGINAPAVFRTRNTTAYLQSTGLALAELPITDPLQQGDTTVALDGMVLGLSSGLPVAISGMVLDPPGISASEILIIKGIVHDNRFTTLTFTTGLLNGYVRSSVTISANVVAATNGESVSELLGSGDASQARQSFVLKRPPLTYVSAPTASGVQSTLSVRVNGILWTEWPSLYGLSSSDRAYTVRIADDGTTTVTFGDGIAGARLPTGSQNVSARYRTGIGLSGNTAAGTVKILQSKPLGVKSAVNPVPAASAADPEDLANARVNAPLKVLTLDRIVSLDDYASFALAFAGVGKAQAVALGNSATQTVGITIADAAGNSPAQTSALLQNLARAVDSARSPGPPVIVSGFTLVLFNLTAALLIDPAYEADVVQRAVTTALTAAFSFGARAFAQSVSAAEVFATIQAVPGVIAVTLTQLYVSTDPGGPSQPEPPPLLAALTARLASGTLVPAQLLLINPAGLTLTEMAP
jgi:predicted phage baseplate assembly protein